MSDEKESPLEREKLEEILAYALTLIEPKQRRENPDQSDQVSVRARGVISRCR